jgi:hypothetical protein
MKVVGYGLALALGLLGLVFIAGHQGVTIRIAVGAILLAGAIALVVALRMKPRVEQRNVVQKIDLSGDVSTQKLECAKCGAQLDKDSIEVRAGAIFVSCKYCQASYQLEEAPRW